MFWDPFSERRQPTLFQIFFLAKEMYFEKKLLLTITMMIVSMIKINETKNRSENKAKENILARHKNTMTE